MEKTINSDEEQTWTLLLRTRLLDPLDKEKILEKTPYKTRNLLCKFITKPENRKKPNRQIYMSSLIDGILRPMREKYNSPTAELNMV